MQWFDATLRYETRQAGKFIKSESELIRMRWFTRFELEHLLMRAGFADVVIYGDFDGSPVQLGAPELVVVATAPG
jgi:hypothetical protein